MTLPALPAEGSVDWYPWAEGLQGAVGPAVAERHARRSRAEVNAWLAETLPNASVAGPVTEATTQIAGGSWYDFITGGVINPTIRYTGAQIAQAGAAFPDNICVTGVGLDSTFGGLPFAADFGYDGAQFEFDYKWRVPASFRVWADGVIVGSTAGPTGTPSGAFYKHLVTLPDARPRQIRLECNGGTFLYGLYTEAGSAVAYPAGNPRGPRVIMFGDSYVEAAGATTDYNTLMYRMAASMGWGDTWRSGSGGTGYLAVPGSPAGRKTLRQRVQTDVIDHAPNIVIIAAGLNDRTFTASAVGTEAGLLFDEIAADLPNAEVIVVGPWGPRDASLLSADTLAISAAIRGRAGLRGWYFIDPIAEEWITGTGYVGATTGVGNADAFIGADGTHPTDAGYAYIAARLAGHLRTLGATGV